MPSKQQLDRELKNALATHIRVDKRQTLSIFDDYVIKHFERREDLDNDAISEKKFHSELNAYTRLNRLGCEFVPELIEHSRSERWLRIRRIPGANLFDLTQQEDSTLPIADIVNQIRFMDIWFSEKQPFLGSTNIKNLILDRGGKLWLVDFEHFEPDADDPSYFDSLVGSLVPDLFSRWFIRRGRTATFSKSFVQLSVAICMIEPRATLKTFASEVYGRWKNEYLKAREKAKRAIKRILGMGH